MAILTGSNGNDNLVGTEFVDTFYGNDGDDILSLGGARFLTNYFPGLTDFAYGGNGSDEYRPAIREIGGVVIEDNGTINSSADAITYLGALMQTGRLGYRGFSSFERIGDDLEIVTASRPTAFRKPGIESVDIQIVNQYAADGTDKIEFLDAGGIRYNLITSKTGTADADILAGSSSKNVFKAGGGTDYVTGNGGNDKLKLGAGDDFGFGGFGNDRLFGGDGIDRLYGGEGHDRIFGGAGVDFIEGDAGNDKIRAGDGDDWILGGAGNDKIFGGAGNDHITGGEGNDRLYGGVGSDTYVFIGPWGTDIINDKGSNQANTSRDTIELRGYFGPSSGSEAQALDRLAIARDGDDMILSTTDGFSTLTVRNQFSASGSNKAYIEQLYLNGAYWSGLMSEIRTSERENLGDDRGWGGKLNELLFGSDASEQFFGDAGTNLIWTGGGADVLIYKQVDNSVWYGASGISVVLSSKGSNDVVMDFDLSLDKLDFTEITSITRMADLTITTEADGNARIFWDSGTIEVANIDIDLRGVSSANLTADNFIFLGNKPAPSPISVGDTLTGTQPTDIISGTDSVNIIHRESNADQLEWVAREITTGAANALSRDTYSGDNGDPDITGGEHTVTFEGVTSLNISDFTIA